MVVRQELNESRLDKSHFNENHLNKSHIVIEGPIGVGKSTLCRKIVDVFGGQVFMEKPAENPFLQKFYKDSKQYGLATQLFFLFQRIQQMTDLDSEASALKKPIVADFMIEKDPIFAELTLQEQELALYRQVYESLSVDSTKPDLVVYLQAPVKVLKQRIKKRNIAYEQKIGDDYLARLCEAYTDFFHRYSTAPLLIVNAAEFDPISNDQHFAALVTQISKIQAGKHFFNPLV